MTLISKKKKYLDSEPDAEKQQDHPKKKVAKVNKRKRTIYLGFYFDFDLYPLLEH